VRTLHPPRAFPLTVAAVSATLATLLFLGSTMPALRERQMLADVETRRLRLRQQLDAVLQAARLREAALECDVEAVLVAIDDLGLTPAELLGDPAAMPD
jgi:hypothetical protein